MSALANLVELLRAEGGAVAELLAAKPRLADRGPGALAAAGPRTVSRAAEYELLMEAIYEGYLLHYGAPRLLRGEAPPSLKVLAGDRLYALGLARVVRLGDLHAVGELADLITICAQAQALRQEELALAAWAAAARAIGWGGNERHRKAKALALAGAPEAVAALRACGA